MVDETVANLKITTSFDGAGLDQANTKLAQTTATADAFKAKVADTGAAMAPASTAAKDLGTNLGSLSSQASVAGNQFISLGTTFRNFGSGLASSLFSLQTWKDTWAQMGPAASTLATGTRGATAAVVEHEGSVRKVNEASIAYRETIHTLDPAVRQLGISVSGLTQFTGAARGGFELLALAIGGALVGSMLKLQDTLQTNTQDIQAFTRNARVTADIMDEFGKAALKGGADVTSMADALSSLMQDGKQGPQAMASYKAAVVGLDEAIVKMGLDTDTASKIQKDFSGVLSASQTVYFTNGESIKAMGGVSAAALQAITKDSKALGEALARSLGFMGNGFQSATAQMLEAANNGTISVDKLMAAVKNLADVTQQGEGSMSQSWGKIKNAWEELIQAMGKDPGVKKTMDGIASSIEEITTKIKAGVPAWQAVWDELVKSETDATNAMGAAQAKLIADMNSHWPDLWKGFMDSWQKISDFLNNLPIIGKLASGLNSAIDTATQGVGANLGNPLGSTGDASSSLNQLDTSVKTTGDDAKQAASGTGTLNDSLQTLSKDFDTTAGSFSTVKTAADGMATSTQTAATGVDAVGTSITNLANTAQAAASNIAAAAAQASQAGSSAGAGDSGPQLPVGSFATGGIVQFGGSGPDDSISISAKVSPGETMAILPPGGASSGLLSQIQGAIGSSPISVSSSGTSAPTSVSAIAAPTNYAAYEASTVNGSPALLPGGYFATAVPSTSIASTTSRSAASTATKSRTGKLNAPAMATIKVGGVDRLVPADLAAIYNQQQAADGSFMMQSGGQMVRFVPDGRGGFLPQSTVNIGSVPSDLGSSLDSMSDKISRGFTNLPGGVDSGGGGGSPASSVSRSAASRGASDTSSGDASGVLPTVIDAVGNYTGRSFLQQYAGSGTPPTTSFPENGVPLPPLDPRTDADIVAQGGVVSNLMDMLFGGSPDTGGEFPGFQSYGTAPGDAYGGYSGIDQSFVDAYATADASSPDAGAFYADQYAGYDASGDYSYGTDTGFASGGSFTIPFTGSGGADTVPMRFNGSPGEEVSVTRPGDKQAGRIGGAANKTYGDVHIHLPSGADAKSFMALSRTATRRQVAGMLP